MFPFIKSFRFFNIPGGERRSEERKRWLQQINRADPNDPTKLLEPPKYAIVCNKHFIQGCPSACHPYPELHLRPYGKNKFLKSAKQLRPEGLYETRAQSEPLHVEIHTIVDNSEVPSSTAVVELENTAGDQQEIANLFPVQKSTKLYTRSTTGSYKIEFDQNPPSSNSQIFAEEELCSEDIFDEIFKRPLPKASQPLSDQAQADADYYQAYQEPERPTEPEPEVGFKQKTAFERVLKGLRFIIFVLLNALRYKNALLDEREREIEDLKADKAHLTDIIRKRHLCIEESINGHVVFTPINSHKNEIVKQQDSFIIRKRATVHEDGEDGGKRRKRGRPSKKQQVVSQAIPQPGKLIGQPEPFYKNPYSDLRNNPDTNSPEPAVASEEADETAAEGAESEPQPREDSPSETDTPPAETSTPPAETSTTTTTTPAGGLTHITSTFITSQSSSSLPKPIATFSASFIKLLGQQDQQEGDSEAAAAVSSIVDRTGNQGTPAKADSSTSFLYVFSYCICKVHW